jgi:hypothetical protein
MLNQIRATQNTVSLENERQASERLHSQLFSFVNSPPLSVDSSRRTERGRLLGVWRELFLIDGKSSDEIEVAKALVSDKKIWLQWVQFLTICRKHLPRLDSHFYPAPDNEQKFAVQLREILSSLSR